jgi:Diacylglycerol kinase catalytic domain
VAAVLGAAALAGFVVVMVTGESLRVLVVSQLLAGASVTGARHALRRQHSAPALRPAPAARHPVLLMNPQSGGGKVDRFGLVDRCVRAGIEPIVLAPGDDLLELAEAAVAQGADLIGMAGGDGSQALVASVASRHAIPFVVVPAGTRNHFALDLGIDRDDVPASLAAFEEGIDRKVDLAEGSTPGCTTPATSWSGWPSVRCSGRSRPGAPSGWQLGSGVVARRWRRRGADGLVDAVVHVLGADQLEHVVPVEHVEHGALDPGKA